MSGDCCWPGNLTWQPYLPSKYWSSLTDKIWQDWTISHPRYCRYLRINISKKEKEIMCYISHFINVWTVIHANFPHPWFTKKGMITMGHLLSWTRISFLFNQSLLYSILQILSHKAFPLPGEAPRKEFQGWGKKSNMNLMIWVLDYEILCLSKNLLVLMFLQDCCLFFLQQITHNPPSTT